MSDNQLTTRPPCPICRGVKWHPLLSETKRWLIHGGRTICGCKRCGLRLVLPLPSYEENTAHFEDENYYSRTVGSKPGIFRRRVELLKSMARGKRLLDVGCAQGELLVLAREAGFEVAGIELSEYACTQAREHFGLDVRNNPITELPSESYDVVHANHVLEHVHDPIDFAREMRRVLAPQGICVIEVPNEFMDLTSRIGRIVRHPKRRTVPSIHLFYFEPKTLRKVMTLAGFQPIKIFTWSRKIKPASRAGVRMRKMRNGLKAVADLTGTGENIVYVGRNDPS